jgi:hypothetical protein
MELALKGVLAPQPSPARGERGLKGCVRGGVDGGELRRARPQHSLKLTPCPTVREARVCVTREAEQGDRPLLSLDTLDQEPLMLRPRGAEDHHEPALGATL